MKKKIVLLRSPVLSYTGYGVHSRQIAKWLLTKVDNIDLKFSILQWGESTWHLEKNRFGGMVQDILSKSVDLKYNSADVSIQVQLPDEWDPTIGKFNIGITAGVETDTCNPKWIEKINQMNLVVVPSNFVRDAFIKTGEVTTRIVVIPESFQEFDESKIDPSFIDFSTDFNFLIFGQITGLSTLTDRKNTFSAVKWILESFKGDPSVGIVVKTNAGKNSIKDRNFCQSIFESLISQTRRSTFPKVHLLHGDLSEEEIFSLYRHPKIKALVSTTRGEGYGLPILEAASQNLPVIATNWSGHLDFLNEGRFIGLDYKLNEIHQSKHDGRIFLKGQKWADVSEEDFKKKIVKFRSSHSIPKEWAVNLGEKIRNKFNIEEIKRQYDLTLGEFIL
jgi:glycosyltransferase involved in cell wall biosynthesis